jgi:septal ring factor EnvC (AmiA/AmiB activator)
LKKYISTTKSNIRLCEDYIEKNPNSTDIKDIKSDKSNMEKDLEELETLLNDYEKKHEQQRDKSADFLKEEKISIY